jgi:lipoprotein-anchoring transpeptidase ErfK/SrfK
VRLPSVRAAVPLCLVAGVAAVAGLAVAARWRAEARVEAHGPLRYRVDDPVVQVAVANASSLRNVHVTLDGRDVTRHVRVDRSGIGIHGLHLRDGWHRLRVQAAQSGWLQGHLDDQLGLLVDTTVPVLRLDDPATAGPRPAVAFTGTTEPGAVVTATWRGGTLTTRARGGSFALDPSLPNGTVAVRLVARDAAGNQTARWQRVTLDTAAPVVKPAAPLPAMVRIRNPLLAGTITDATPVTATATFDGQPVRRLRFAADARGPWSVRLRSLAEGRHIFMLEATDAAGNTTRFRRVFVVNSVERLGPGISLRLGAVGADVRQLERRLRGEHLWTGPVTPVYTARTARAVARFQTANGMPGDGVAGPAVIAATAGRIVVSLHLFRVTVYHDGRKVFSAPIAEGQPAYPTPVGHFVITDKIENPTWVPPNSPWAAGLEPIPPGPGNPLGPRWIGTSAPNVGFHGTPETSSVGHPESHGCMRMYPADVIRMYPLVSVGMPVDIEE